LRKSVTLIPVTDLRVESGPLRFGDDWPGLFLRGDDALGIAGQIDRLLSVLTADQVSAAPSAVLQVHELAKLIHKRVFVKR
jgi:hypothetical protein